MGAGVGVVGAAEGADVVGEAAGRPAPEPDVVLELAPDPTGAAAASVGSGVGLGAASAATDVGPGVAVTVGWADTEGRAVSASTRESPSPIASVEKANVVSADESCRYLRIEDSPALDVQSDAARTVVVVDGEEIA